MRYYYNKKATVEESCDLTVFQLKEYGMLESGFNAIPIEWVMNQTGKRTRIVIGVDLSTDDPIAILMYTLTDRNGNKNDYKYAVSLLTTPCNLGGIRYWFTCPCCGRRVGGIYLAPGDIHFRCRHCNNLTYRSRNRCPIESEGHTSRQIDKLRSEIKRWTWGGRPTKKVRRLRALERKAHVLGEYSMRQIEKLEARIRNYRG